MSMGLDPLRQVRGIGIDQYKAGLGEYLGAVASDAWANGPLAQAGRLIEATGRNADAQDRGEALLSAEEASNEGRDLGLRFDAPIARGAYNVLADEKRREVAAEATFKRARLEDGYGTLHWLLGGGTEFLTQAADPLNIASAFVPVVGEARYAAMAARMGRLPAALAKGAAEGAVGQGLLEPLQIADRHQMGDDYTMLDTLTNLAFGGGLGVVLHGAGYGLGAGFRFMRDRYVIADRAAPESTPPHSPVQPNPVPEERPVPSLVREETAPPRQPVAEQMEKLRPETKDAAMRTAIAQLAQDKPVDIEPVLRADPGWHAVQAEIEKAHLAEVPQLQRQSVASQPLPSTEPPADWQPSRDELKQAQRLARGWTPEKAEQAPLSLSEFVDRRGGVKAAEGEASNLLAQDLKRLVKESGVSHDELARLAQEAGYRFAPDTGVGNGVDATAFLSALIDDASGVRRLLPETEHTEAWRAQQQFFDSVRDWLGELGLDPKGMEPHQLAWILSRDPDTGRLLSLLGRIDKLGEADSLELAYRLDEERAQLEREIVAEEPGRFEQDAAVADHREVAPATLEELERYHAEFDRAAGPGEAGQEAVGRDLAAGRADESGEAGAARRDGRDAEAEGPGLRRQGGQGEGAEGPRGAAGDLRQNSAADLGEFAERQAKADLQADPAALDQRDQRLAGEARDLQQLLADDLKDYGHLIDKEARGELDRVTAEYDATARAAEALAACQSGRG